MTTKTEPRTYQEWVALAKTILAQIPQSASAEAAADAARRALECLENARRSGTTPHG